MGSIGVNMSVTLDGVLQAPARAGEVTRGGFTHGGWGQGYHEDLAVQDAPRSAPGTFATVWGQLPELVSTDGTILIRMTAVGWVTNPSSARVRLRPHNQGRPSTGSRSVCRQPEPQSTPY